MAATETSPELPLFDLRLREQDLQAVGEVLRSGWLTMGPRTAAFEEAFAAQLGARHAVAVPLQRFAYLLLLHVPEMDELVAVAGGQRLAVG